MWESIQANFSDLISFLVNNGLINNLVIALAALQLQVIIIWVFKNLANFMPSMSQFTVSGFWVGSFDSHIPGKHNYELVKINQSNEKIKLYIQQYNNLTKEIKKYKGNGIFRGSRLCAVYYPLNKGNFQVGNVALRLVNTNMQNSSLAGDYSEIDEQSDAFLPQHKEYKLYKIELDFKRRLKSSLPFLKSFNSYYDLHNYLNEIGFQAQDGDQHKPKPYKSQVQ